MVGCSERPRRRIRCKSIPWVVFNIISGSWSRLRQVLLNETKRGPSESCLRLEAASDGLIAVLKAILFPLGLQKAPQFVTRPIFFSRYAYDGRRGQRLNPSPALGLATSSPAECYWRIPITAAHQLQSATMAKQLVLALLCAAVAVAAARELSQAKITVSELPKQLQELNSRCVKGKAEHAAGRFRRSRIATYGLLLSQKSCS